MSDNNMALQVMAERLQVEPSVLKDTLKNTIIKKATDAEFMSFVIIANSYKLNPLMKEMFAFPDKSGGIIPIVSTDGWNKIMQNNPEYKSHSYIESEEYITMPSAKPCPKWMEIHIQKKDGSETVVREHLDECFRNQNFTNPWQTHTKRMLRHKTKIQGAREAFGLGGIYDEDEAERIVEAQVVRTITSTKPVVAMPEEVVAEPVAEQQYDEKGEITAPPEELFGEPAEKVDEQPKQVVSNVSEEQSKKNLSLARDTMAKCKTLEEMSRYWPEEVRKENFTPEDYEKVCKSKEYFKSIFVNRAKQGATNGQK
jgi:phage recombination protein Bet